MEVKKYPLPNLIIFEDFNLPSEEKLEINLWLTDRGYNLTSEGGISMAKK